MAEEEPKVVEENEENDEELVDYEEEEQIETEKSADKGKEVKK